MLRYTCLVTIFNYRSNTPQYLSLTSSPNLNKTVEDLFDSVVPVGCGFNEERTD
jgi:hypothetical protein